MKLLIISLTFFFTQNILAFQAEQPEMFSSAPMGLYVPQGFDSNDNVEIFFEGEFSDACHKVGLTAHDVDEEKRHIYVTDMAYYFGQDFCAQMIVPYQKGVNAGILRSGQWKVFFRHSRGNFVEQGTIPVRTATNAAPDDHLYAPVQKTVFKPGTIDKPNRLELVGKFYNTCMRLDYVKVNNPNGSNVVEIQPIAIMDRGGCEEAPEGISFNHTVNLNKLNPGRFLLHTRANNGRSVNEIVTIR
jgi:hypothetical protein